MKGSTRFVGFIAAVVALCGLTAQAADRELLRVRNLDLGDASVRLTAANGIIKNSPPDATAPGLDRGKFVLDEDFVLPTNNLFRVKPFSVTVTNAGTIPLVSSVTIVTPSGVNVTTQTNEVAEPGLYNEGTYFTIWNAGPTNILIAEVADLVMAGNVTLGTGDGITFYAINSNTWQEVSRVNN